MNRWSSLGSLTLILGAIGHFVIVDLSVWILEANYVHWLPESLLGRMKSTVIDFGVFGKQTFFYAFAGFSLWVVLSLFIIGLYNLLIFRALPLGHKLRLQSLILGLLTSLTFLIVAIICFIYPATIGGLLAVLCFSLAIQKERALAR